jgi:hypothetical protein
MTRLFALRGANQYLSGFFYLRAQTPRKDEEICGNACGPKPVRTGLARQDRTSFRCNMSGVLKIGDRTAATAQFVRNRRRPGWHPWWHRYRQHRLPQPGELPHDLLHPHCSGNGFAMPAANPLQTRSASIPAVNPRLDNLAPVQPCCPAAASNSSARRWFIASRRSSCKTLIGYSSEVTRFDTTDNALFRDRPSASA